MASFRSPNSTCQPMTMLDDKASHVRDILSIQKVVSFFSDNDPRLTIFLNDRLLNLLDVCLKDGNESEGSIAFLLLMKMDSRFVDGKVFIPTLLNSITKVMSNTNIKDYILGRVASLMIFAISQFTEQSHECCDYLFQLLKYIDLYYVAEAFNTICSYESTNLVIQAHLIDSGFASNVSNLLETTSNVEIQANLLNLISNCSKKGLLRDSFSEPNIISQVIKYLDSPSEAVVSRIWKCLQVWCKDSTVSLVEPAVTNAIETISEMYDDVREYRVNAVLFLGSIMAIKASVVSKLIEGRFLQVVLRLLIQFPNSSNLISALFYLLRSGMWQPAFTLHIVKELFRPIVLEAMSKTRSAVAANSLSFINEIWHYQASRKEVRQAIQSIMDEDPTVMPFILRHNYILNNPYGGEFENQSRIFID